MAQEMRFDGRVAVITGGGRGLGREYCLLLAARGAKVVVNNRVGAVPGEDPAADVVGLIREAGGEAIVYHGDVAAPGFGEGIIKAALDTYGRIDIVIANAGAVLTPHSFEETTPESFEAMYAMHFRGTYGLLHAAWPHLKRQDYGRVVVTSSASGLYGQPGGIEYSAAKGAITGLFRALATETEGAGIRLNLMSPGGATGPAERLNFDAETLAFLKTNLNPALVAPVMAMLVHEDCAFNGRMFSAGGGHVGRVMIGESVGVWPSEQTPEAYARVAAEIDEARDLVFHEDAITWSGWLAQTAGERRSSAK